MAEEESEKVDPLAETFRSILRNAYLRGVTHASGTGLMDLTEGEAATLLEPFEDALAEDVDFCVAVGGQYRISGAHQANTHEAAQPLTDTVTLSTEDE